MCPLSEHNMPIYLFTSEYEYEYPLRLIDSLWIQSIYLFIYLFMQ